MRQRQPRKTAVLPSSGRPFALRRTLMKAPPGPLLAIAFILPLTACNVDTMGTAATAAALKKQELEQGKQTMKTAQQKIDNAVQQMNQSAASRGDDGIK